tara:strand:- start:1362 stop:2021 length:660 start_codon:yes stop_codon:yes gene_type:complete
MIHLLSSSAFIICNKILAKKLGLKSTILLSDLISKHEYFLNNNLLNAEGYFFNTQENIEEDTTLTPYQQRNAIKTLLKEKLIETKKIGIPAKLHYKINEDQVIKFLDNKKQRKSTYINKNKTIISNNNKSKTTRKEKFEKIVFSLNFGTQLCRDFIQYWTEENKSGKKMRFEMEKTFDIKRRLQRWEKNEKKWASPKIKTKFSKLDSQLSEWEKAKKLL